MGAGASIVVVDATAVGKYVSSLVTFDYIQLFERNNVNSEKLKQLISSQSTSLVKLKEYLINIGLVNENHLNIICNDLYTKFHDVTEKSMGMEMRGVKLLLLKKIAELAKLRLSGSVDVGRISNVLLGTHELKNTTRKSDGSWECRWFNSEDGIIDINSTVTGPAQTSLIDLLLDKYFNNPHPELGVTYQEVVKAKADVFISFAYLTDYFDLISCIERFLEENSELDPDNTYFWFDPFVNDQWTADSKSFDWWSTTFKTAIAEFGHTAVVLSPWINPTYLCRAWCLWELYCSVVTGSKIDLLIPPRQQEMFLRSMACKPSIYSDMLAQLDVRKADCWVKEDLRRIFAAIESSDGGVSHVNKVLFEQLRRMYEKIINTKKAISSRVIHGDGCSNGTVAEHTLAAEHFQKGMFYKQIDKQRSLTHFQEYLEISEKIGDNRAVVAARLMILKLYVNLDLLDEAEDMIDILIVSDETVTGNAEFILVFADLMFKQGKFQSAAEMGEMGLSIIEEKQRFRASEGKEELEEKDLIELLVCKNNLMFSYSRMEGAEEKMTELEQECLKIRDKLDRLGSDKGTSDTFLNNLGLQLLNQKKYDEAKPLLEGLLLRRREKLGDEHEDTLLSMNNLALYYDAISDHLKSCELYEEALAICRKTNGYFIVGVLLNLGQLKRKKMKAYGEAIELFSESLQIIKGKFNFPDTHPDAIDAMQYLGLAYGGKGERETACQWLFKCLACQRENPQLGNDHSETTSTIDYIQREIVLGCNDGLAVSMMPLCRELLRITKEMYGDQDERTLETLQSLGEIMLVTGEEYYEEAQECLAECWRSRKQVLGQNHIDTLRSKSVLKGLYMKMELYAACFDIDGGGRMLMHMDHEEALEEAAILETELEALRSMTTSKERICSHINQICFHYFTILDDKVRALPYLDEVFELEKELLGLAATDTTVTLSKIARCYESMRDYERSKPLWRLYISIMGGMP